MIRTIQGPSPIWRVEGDRRTFNPSCQVQNDFVTSLAPDSLFTGGWGDGGKTIALCVRVLTLSKIYQGNVGGFCRKVKSDANTSSIPKLRQVLGDELWEESVVGGNEDPAALVFRNGSRVNFLGFDRPEKFLSADYGFIAIDECNEVSHKDWTFAAGRLRLASVPWRGIFGACNPASPAHHLYRRFRPDLGSHKIYDDPRTCDACEGSGTIEEWFLDDATGRTWAESGPCEPCQGSGKVVRLIAETFVATPQDNAQNQVADYRQRKARLTGTMLKRYGQGLWVDYSGMVFSNLEPNLHFIDPPAAWTEHWGGFPPPTWRRYRAIDFGYVAPFSCLWIARDPDNALYVYREIYHTQRTVNAHKRQMLEWEDQELAVLQACVDRKNERLEPNQQIERPARLAFSMTVCDHDSEDRATLEEPPRVIATEPAIKGPRLPGIEAVLERLIPFKVENVRRAGLYVLRNSLREPDQMLLDDEKRPPTCLMDEMTRLIFKEDKEGQRMKEDTVGADHACDALCYCVKMIKAVGDMRIVRLFQPGELGRQRDD